MNARPVKKAGIQRASGRQTSGRKGQGGEDGHAHDPGPNPVNSAELELAQAVCSLRTVQEARLFLRDLCTPSEISALSERWHVARLLDAGDLSYRDIQRQTGVSTTTVARVARFLFHEPNRGYQLLLGRLKEHDHGQQKAADSNPEVRPPRR